MILFYSRMKVTLKIILIEFSCISLGLNVIAEKQIATIIGLIKDFMNTSSIFRIKNLHTNKIHDLTILN